MRASRRDEELFLYQIRASREAVRKLLEVYLERINELADRPEFYHLLQQLYDKHRALCQCGRSQGQVEFAAPFEWMGDACLYAAGHVDTTLPFEELRRRSRITEKAKAAADQPDFSQRIREKLPSP